ncbi:MAG TPA: MarR family transcriptional regulator [Candidatus Dormibacteraeota bacterium]|nr:MarR family transcriptional regulator [Candidatus Dormibacteraeota bacterium]
MMLPFVSGVDGRTASFEELARSSAESLHREVDLDVVTAALNLVRVANLLVGDLESRVHRPSGWTWAGFRVMFVVFVTQKAEPSEVARLAGVSRASVSGVLNTLERDGLVVRRRSSADRRIITVRLTARGRRATIEAFKKNHEVEKLWLTPLTADETRALIALLHRLHSPYRAGAKPARPRRPPRERARRSRGPSSSARRG